MAKAKVLGICAFATLGACSFAPVSELRELPPTRSESFAVDYLDLATCTAEGLQMSGSSDFSVGPGALLYESIHRNSIGTFFLTGRSAQRGSVMIDIIFRKNGEKVTTVETRQGLFNGAQSRGSTLIEDKTWPVIKHCAAP